MDDDVKHLNLLSVFHYIVGGISALFSCMFIGHLIIGIVLVISPGTMTGDSGPPPPAFFGYLFAVMGGLFLLLGIAFSVCVIYSGLVLKKRKKYLFSFVMACIECFFMPFGTALGVFTIVVLSRDSVKQLYKEEAEP